MLFRSGSAADLFSDERGHEPGANGHAQMVAFLPELLRSLFDVV